ncbi:MAG: hypothetical protein H8D67_28580 [Deltaproteobacteria bacterium]|nr:hypothetical protein [Deltaproteobacteria bacterium]MBL7075786.1 hypothetical protein [candidate division KSB1 bacterium]
MDSAVSYQYRAFGTINNPGRRPPAWAQSTISNSSLTPPHSDMTNSSSLGSWNRIEFSSSSTNSRMSWCKIEYANFGVYSDGASPELNHLIVRNCSDTGICFSSVPSILHHLSFILAEGNRVGLQFEGVSSGLIERNVVVGNDEVGIV